MDELVYRTVFVGFFRAVVFFSAVTLAVPARCLVGVRFLCAGAKTAKANAMSMIK